MKPPASEFSALESDVVRTLLTGDAPGLQVLREQWSQARLLHREATGVGFFTHFSLPLGVHRLSKANARIGDVLADVAGLQNGAGFILWVEAGVISCLEGYSFGEDWPSDIDRYALRYEHRQRKLPADLL